MGTPLEVSFCPRLLAEIASLSSQLAELQERAIYSPERAVDSWSSVFWVAVEEVKLNNIGLL